MLHQFLQAARIGPSRSFYQRTKRHLINCLKFRITERTLHESEPRGTVRASAFPLLRAAMVSKSVSFLCLLIRQKTYFFQMAGDDKAFIVQKYFSPDTTVSSSDSVSSSRSSRV